ncbi:cyclin [Moesziomyces antarcticus T-34]|uniref:Cyclin n=1 Tax=Pseudozyma antarctica (strain T-34) TaxID=1151754 RepID=M9LWA0_PSEA3|nr:cyclin [Moesziomyces antarcticus T-34]
MAQSLSALSSPSRAHLFHGSPQHVSSSSSSSLNISFPTPVAVAPAALTPASAHAASPSQASTSAIHMLSAPKSTPPRHTHAITAMSPQSHPPSATAPAPASAPTTAASAAAPASASNPKVLPYLFDDAQLDDVLVLVVDMLVKLTEHNDGLPLHPSALTRFHSRATPNISLSAYLRRIAKYTSIEKCCVLILLVYIDRVCERLEGFTICGLTVHRFICAAILCASKALCDAFNTNEHYAKVGGISLQEINLLEKEFLQIIDWRLICSGAVLQHYYASLVRSHSCYVLAPPPADVQMPIDVPGASAMDEDDPNAPVLASTKPHSHGDRSEVLESNGARLRGSIAITSAMAAPNSQHSSPLPLSSNSASPFTPASVAGATRPNGGMVAASTSGSSASPSSAMHVDAVNPADPADPRSTASAVPSRRRKDEQRTPPSPRSVQPTPVTGAAAAVDGGGLDAHKRTRLDHPAPPS